MILTVVALVGCTLEEEVISSSQPSTYYKTVPQCITGLNGCYIPLKQLYGNGDYFEVCEAAADLIYHSSTTYYDAAGEYDQVQTRFGATMWRLGYQGVMRCNAMYAAIERAPLSEKEKAPLFAECTILRAFYYYILTINFGDVPFYFEAITDANNDIIAQYPRMDAKVLRTKLMDQLSYWLCSSDKEWLPEDKEYQERLAEYKAEQFDLTGKEPRVMCRQALPYIKTYDPLNEYRIGSMVGFVIAGKLAMWNIDFHRAIDFYSYIEDVYGSLSAGEYEPENALADYPISDVMFRNRYTPESIFELPGYAKDYGLRVTSGLASRCTPSRKTVEVDGEATEDEELDDEEIESLSKKSDVYGGIRIPELGSEARTTSPYRPTKRFYQTLMPYRFKDAASNTYMVDKRSAVYDASKFSTDEINVIEGGGGYLAWCYAAYDPKDPTQTEPKMMYFSGLSNSSRPFLGDKFWCPGMVYTQDSNNKKIFRFATILFDLAEANMRLKKWDKANGYLNASRKRAGLPLLDITDEAQFMSEVQDESGRELFGEYGRRHELVRWGIWSKNVGLYAENSLLKVNAVAKPYLEYYPIPDEQIILSNGNLKNDKYDGN